MAAMQRQSVGHLECLRKYITTCGGDKSLLGHWRAVIQDRTEGETAGTTDVYYFSPTGRRFRSLKEVARFFNLKPVPTKGAARFDKKAGQTSNMAVEQTDGGQAAYAEPPACRAGYFAAGTIRLGSDGRSSWKVGDMLTSVNNGKCDWVCVDLAGLSMKTKRMKSRAAPPKPPAAPAPDAAAESDLVAWVCCDACGKWREVPRAPVGGGAWFCSMHPDRKHRKCGAAEEAAEVVEGAEDDEVAYGVERLLGQKVSARSIKYLVRWSGYGEEEDSWEGASNICDPVLIRDLEADLRRLGTAKALRDEGLTLVPMRSDHPHCTGYAGVQKVRGTSRIAFTASSLRTGKLLGEFSCAKAAAHACARDLGPQASAAAAAEALAVAPSAEAPVEGAAEAPAKCAAEGVCGEELSEIERKRAEAIVSNRAMFCALGLDEAATAMRETVDGAETEPGTESESEDTTEDTTASTAAIEAAVETVIREVERRAAAAAALQAAEEEGLTLVPKVGSASGYHNVNVVGQSHSPCGFKAISRKQGKAFVLGIFDTPEEAALCVARNLGAEKSRKVYESHPVMPGQPGQQPIRYLKPVAAACAVDANGAVQLRLRVRKPGGRTGKIDPAFAKRNLETSLNGGTWLWDSTGHAPSGSADGMAEEPPAKRIARRAVVSAPPVAVAWRPARSVDEERRAGVERRGTPVEMGQTTRVPAWASLLPGAPSRDPAISMGTLRRRSEVGEAHQAIVAPDVLVASWRGPPHETPPLCECGMPTEWSGRYAVCASGGCAFIAEVPPVPLTPLCSCQRPCVWAHRRWWCATSLGQREHGCGYEGTAQVAHASPTCISRSELSLSAAAQTAALLTASAFGIAPWAFVAPADCGLGLYARQDLEVGQAICEYVGPRLPIEMLQHGTYALAVSAVGKANGRVFIDGNYEHVPYGGPRAVAIYANHSTKPNAYLQHWPVPALASGAASGEAEVRDRMWLVAKEGIPSGAEIRFNYEAGGERYWGARPEETSWRAVRLRAPPPSGESPFFYSPDGPPSADVDEMPLEPLAWDGPHGGVARLRWLLPRLACHTTNGHGTNWALVSTHVPGRSADECRVQWDALRQSMPIQPMEGTIKPKEGAAQEPKAHCEVESDDDVEAGTNSSTPMTWLPSTYEQVGFGNPWIERDASEDADRKAKRPKLAEKPTPTPKPSEASRLQWAVDGDTLLGRYIETPVVFGAPPLRDEEGRVTEAEGLQLQLSSNASGYVGVHRHGHRFVAQYQRGGKTTYLGYFGTAVEAAIAYARQVQLLGLGVSLYHNSRWRQHVEC